MIENGRLLPTDNRSFEDEDGNVLPLPEPFVPEPFDFDSIEAPGPDEEDTTASGHITKGLGSAATVEQKPVAPKPSRRPNYGGDWARAAANDPIEDDDDE
ncbi:MAG: hypothetical protein JWO99_772 [Candidatus Saccharibacteria bacterium]|nr:hypothetical protein [Candidatus Saccharibacteria bacterium]